MTSSCTPGSRHPEARRISRGPIYVYFNHLRILVRCSDHVIGTLIDWLYCISKKMMEPQKCQKKTKVTAYQLLVFSLLFPFVSFVVQIKLVFTEHQMTSGHRPLSRTAVGIEVTRQSSILLLNAILSQLLQL